MNTELMKIAIPDDYQSVAPGGTRLERLDLLIAELDCYHCHDYAKLYGGPAASGSACGCLV